MGVSFFGLVATFARNALVEERGPDTRESATQLVGVERMRSVNTLAIEPQTISTLSGAAKMSLERM